MVYIISLPIKKRKPHKMKFYLSGRFEDCVEIDAIGNKLKEKGHIITSQWHQGKGYRIEAAEQRGLYTIEEKRAISKCNLFDITMCDILAIFTFASYSIPNRGGRFFEFGYAYSINKRCAVVGPIENFFCALDCGYHFENAKEFLDAF